MPRLAVGQAAMKANEAAEYKAHKHTPSAEEANKAWNEALTSHIKLFEVSFNSVFDEIKTVARERPKEFSENSPEMIANNC